MSKTVNPNNMTTPEVRFSYLFVMDPKEDDYGNKKWSACILLDKSNKAEKARWDAAIQAAIQIGIQKKKFTKAQIPILKTPIRDGDAEIKTELRKPGQGYENCWFVNASSYNAVDVVKRQGTDVVPITDAKEVYSGMMGRAIISFYPYDTNAVGITVGLNGVYKTRDFDRLDGRVNASQAFAGIAEEEAVNDSDDVADDDLDSAFD